MSAKKHTIRAKVNPVKPTGPVPALSADVDEPNALIADRIPFLIATLVWLLVLMVRFRLLQIPLERDEGGFAYVARQLFSGPPLYDGLYDNKLPGLYGLYAFFIHVFGYSPWGVHFGLLLCNVAAGYFLYRWVALRFSTWSAYLATAFFALLSVAPNVLGFVAHATQLLLPFSLAGLWCCERAFRYDTGRHWLISGLLLGAGFMIKQSAVVFGLFAGFDLLIRAWINRKHVNQPVIQIARRLGWLVLGAALPFLLTVGYFAATGRMQALWLWTVDLPAYAGADNWKFLSYYLNTHFPYVFKHFEMLWGAAVLGAVGIWFGHRLLADKLAALLFLVLSSSSVFIGLSFYPHYFVLALPAVAVLTALLLEMLRERMRDIVPLSVAVVLLLVPIVRNPAYYFTNDPNTVQRLAYGSNLFPELRKIGQELGRRTTPDQRIAVMGSEPEVMVYANRASATGHLFMYPILEEHPAAAGFRQDYLRDLQKNQPEYIVFNTLATSWRKGYADEYFFKMVQQFVEQNYTVVGKAELFGKGRPSVMVWDEAAARYNFEADKRILIYRLKPSLIQN